MIVKAPLSGMIALENQWKNSGMVPPTEGDQVYPGYVLMRIFDPSQMVVNAQVNQADGSRLKPGAKAKVYLDAYPGKEFDAELEYVSPVASAAALWGSPVKTFPARFRLLKTDSVLLPDLSAAIDIVAPKGGAAQ
jgi:Cu(I)/Ag(I) efflux system membrane fusion protein